jgi:hypothetical protein
MTTPLREGVKNHLNQYQLNDDQMQHLMAMQEESVVAEKPSQPQGWNIRAMQLASVAAALVIAVLLAWPAAYSPRNDSKMPLAIAMEVAKNHIKLKPLEVKSPALEPIRRYFTELDFTPVKSQLYDSRGNSLLGARYCSIAGVSAAQLRYKDELGQFQTLYEVGYDPAIYGVLPDINKGETPLTIVARGVKTTIWVEQDLLMVSAENNDVGDDLHK